MKLRDISLRTFVVLATLLAVAIILLLPHAVSADELWVRDLSTGEIVSVCKTIMTEASNQ